MSAIFLCFYFHSSFIPNYVIQQSSMWSGGEDHTGFMILRRGYAFFLPPERNIEILDLFTLLTLPLSWSKSCKTLSYTITMEAWWGLCCQTHESLEPMRTSQPSVSRCCRKLLFSCFSSLCYWIVCLFLILWICLEFAQSPEWWLAL